MLVALGSWYTACKIFNLRSLLRSFKQQAPEPAVPQGTARVPIHFIRPCNPIRATTPPVGDAWLHEPKLDGYRLQIVKSGRAVRLYSRHGHEWTERQATLADALAGIPRRSAV